ncbi:uncharacterized protein LOC142141019 [Mixophyes fleayi]|uniref:uncharacterized protein LOC142141019 n=1 Tax=Mixophyes fleayi TaxID=3061075 RepID=UPI003F4E232A
MSLWPVGLCAFCRKGAVNEKTGEMLISPGEEIMAHYNCVLFSPAVVSSESGSQNIFGGFDITTVKKEIKRGNRMKCVYCYEYGASVGCDIKSCKNTYHYVCVEKAGGECIEDLDKQLYIAYCKRHKNTEQACVANDESDDGPHFRALPSTSEVSHGNIRQKKKRRKREENNTQRNTCLTSDSDADDLPVFDGLNISIKKKTTEKNSDESFIEQSSEQLKETLCSTPRKCTSESSLTSSYSSFHHKETPSPRLPKKDWRHKSKKKADPQDEEILNGNMSHFKMTPEAQSDTNLHEDKVDRNPSRSSPVIKHCPVSSPTKAMLPLPKPTSSSSGRRKGLDQTVSYLQRKLNTASPSNTNIISMSQMSSIDTSTSSTNCIAGQAKQSTESFNVKDRSQSIDSTSGNDRLATKLADSSTSKGRPVEQPVGFINGTNLTVTLSNDLFMSPHAKTVSYNNANKSKSVIYPNVNKLPYQQCIDSLQMKPSVKEKPAVSPNVNMSLYKQPKATTLVTMSAEPMTPVVNKRPAVRSLNFLNEEPTKIPNTQSTSDPQSSVSSLAQYVEQPATRLSVHGAALNQKSRLVQEKSVEESSQSFKDQTNPVSVDSLIPPDVSAPETEIEAPLADFPRPQEMAARLETHSKQNSHTVLQSPRTLDSANDISQSRNERKIQPMSSSVFQSPQTSFQSNEPSSSASFNSNSYEDISISHSEYIKHTLTKLRQDLQKQRQQQPEPDEQNITSILISNLRKVPADKKMSTQIKLLQVLLSVLGKNQLQPQAGPTFPQI